MKDFLESIMEWSYIDFIDWQIIAHGVTLKRELGDHAAGSYFTYAVLDLEAREFRLENANEELEEGDDEVVITRFPLEMRITHKGDQTIWQWLIQTYKQVMGTGREPHRGTP